MLKRLLVLSLMLSALTGCGQVMVFGRVIGEPRPPSESAELPTAAERSVSKTADNATSNTSVQDASLVAESMVPSPQIPSSPIVHHVRAVTLAFTPEASAKAAADPRFEADALLEAVEAELRSRKLLDAQDSAASTAAEILISDFATRSTTNAVVFGYNLGAGSLTGDIRMRDPSTPDAFKVVAETRLAIAANGADKNPLAPLYRRFAVLTADRLAGTPSKADGPDRDLMPR